MIKFKELAEINQPLLEKIIQHPFNQELANATLPPEKFIFYLRQDALYLADFSRALKITANRLEQAEHRDLLTGFSEGALNAERELHENYFKQYHVQPTAYEQQPACFAYTQFLLNLATNAEPVVAITGLLPCFWVYQKVAEWIYQNHVPNNPFFQWIAMYSSPDFAESTAAMTNLFDDCAVSVTDAAIVKEVFSRGMQLEYFFWEGAYRKLDWEK